MGEEAERKGKKRKRKRERKRKGKGKGKERKWVRTRSILVVNYQPHRGGVE